MPGYGFSGKPTATGWDPARIAGTWVALMQRLGYMRFVAQGGDWGGLITEVMAAQAPPGLLGIHTNFPGTVPANVEKALQAGDPPPSSLAADERRAYEQLQAGSKQRGYATEMGTARKRCHALLVDQHGGVCRPPVLRKRVQFLRRQEHLQPHVLSEELRAAFRSLR
jgi:pimeloyl-ACP methyl ester carboxylesterase